MSFIYSFISYANFGLKRVLVHFAIDGHEHTTWTPSADVPHRVALVTRAYFWHPRPRNNLCRWCGLSHRKASESTALAGHRRIITTCRGLGGGFSWTHRCRSNHDEGAHVVGEHECSTTGDDATGFRNSNGGALPDLRDRVCGVNSLRERAAGSSAVHEVGNHDAVTNLIELLQEFKSKKMRVQKWSVRDLETTALGTKLFLKIAMFCVGPCFRLLNITLRLSIGSTAVAAST